MVNSFMNFRFLHCTGCPTKSDFLYVPISGTPRPQILMTNDSFSSQTWAIFIPKRNSEFKSIVWPAGPPQVRSQNQGFSQYLIKIEENIGIFSKFGNNLSTVWLKIVFIKLLCYKSLKNCHKYGFKHT